jgi:hypothetical protein
MIHGLRSMKPACGRNRARASRWLAIGAALTWGMVELLALQRSRYSAWRQRG